MIFKQNEPFTTKQDNKLIHESMFEDFLTNQWKQNQSKINENFIKYHVSVILEAFELSVVSQRRDTS